jgi:hypothetical protein
MSEKASGRPITFYLEDDHYARLQEAAKRNHTSLAAQARRIVIEGLGKESMKSSEPASGPQALAEFQTTLAEDRLLDLQKKNEQLSVEVARLERDVAQALREIVFIKERLEVKRVRGPKKREPVAK